jgi:Flp pilus assembly pilin Flp
MARQRPRTAKAKQANIEDRIIKLATLFKAFAKDETGAVTVDWVVLTAALIGIGMLVLMPVAFSADSASNQIGDDIGVKSIGYKSQ